MTFIICLGYLILKERLHLCDVSSDFLYKDLFGGPFFAERRDSDGWEKTEAYSIEEAGRQSREKKTEYERTDAG